MITLSAERGNWKSKAQLERHGATGKAWRNWKGNDIGDGTKLVPFVRDRGSFSASQRIKVP